MRFYWQIGLIPSNSRELLGYAPRDDGSNPSSSVMYNCTKRKTTPKPPQKEEADEGERKQESSLSPNFGKVGEGLPCPSKDPKNSLDPKKTQTILRGQRPLKMRGLK